LAEAFDQRNDLGAFIAVKLPSKHAVARETGDLLGREKRGTTGPKPGSLEVG